MPWWTERQLRRLLQNLLSKEVLITGNYNKRKGDKTLWYAFSEEDRFLEIIEGVKLNKFGVNSQSALPELTNSTDQIVQPLPIDKTVINNTINTDDYYNVLIEKYKNILENPKPNERADIKPVLILINHYLPTLGNDACLRILEDSFITMHNSGITHKGYLLKIIENKMNDAVKSHKRALRNRETIERHKSENQKNDPEEVNRQFDTVEYFLKNYGGLLSEDEFTYFQIKINGRNETDLFGLYRNMFEVITHNNIEDNFIR
jgi:hypothetical protein